MRVSRAMVGGNGLKMLLLAVMLMLCSGGVSLLLVLFLVLRTGHRADTGAPAGLAALVPGMQLRRGELTADYRLRLERALALYGVGPRKLYILGGTTSPDAPSEAAAGADYLQARGVCRDDLHREERSRHTLENLRCARDLIGCSPSIIVSNRYHLARLAAMAQGLGMQFVLCAAEPRWSWSGRGVGRLLLEAFYLHWYLVGRGWARLTRDRASQARIS